MSKGKNKGINLRVNIPELIQHVEEEAAAFEKLLDGPMGKEIEAMFSDLPDEDKVTAKGLKNAIRRDANRAKKALRKK